MSQVPLEGIESKWLVRNITFLEESYGYFVYQKINVVIDVALLDVRWR